MEGNASRTHCNVYFNTASTFYILEDYGNPAPSIRPILSVVLDRAVGERLRRDTQHETAKQNKWLFL